MSKGVYPYNGKWVAKVWEEKTGRHSHVGTFTTKEEARYARLLHLNGHHWEGLPPDAVEKEWGFLYLVTNQLNGRLYVGRKQFLWWNGPPGGYKCTDRSNEEWFTPAAWKESDWKSYVSSCIPLQKDIKHYGVENFTFEVLAVADGKIPLHQAEVNEMVKRDVLEATNEEGEYLYYNANIASLEFRAPFRKDKVVVAQEQTVSEMEQYYLRPTVCGKCHAVIPFGYSQCKECS